MTKKDIKKLLEQTLLRDGVMHYSLYEYELEESIDEFKSSLEADQDDYIFCGDRKWWAYCDGIY
jgi:hypothetical protein